MMISVRGANMGAEQEVEKGFLTPWSGIFEDEKSVAKNWYSSHNPLYDFILGVSMSAEHREQLITMRSWIARCGMSRDEIPCVHCVPTFAAPTFVRKWACQKKRERMDLKEIEKKKRQIKREKWGERLMQKIDTWDVKCVRKLKFIENLGREWDKLSFEGGD